MPKLRLSEVIAEKSIKVADLSEDIQKAINTLLTQENNLGKIDEKTAKDLRAIANSLDVSLFDLFIPAEKFYRLKIIEHLKESEYLGSPKEKLEKLFTKLPSSSKISFNLLTIYATQVLPESLLKRSDLKQICQFLNIRLEALKDLFYLPRQTISIESILLKLAITLDELSLLIEIPKEFIPWINLEVIKLNKISNSEKESAELTLTNNEKTATVMITSLGCDFPVICLMNPDCSKPCR